MLGLSTKGILRKTSDWYVIDLIREFKKTVYVCNKAIENKVAQTVGTLSGQIKDILKDIQESNNVLRGELEKKPTVSTGRNRK